jgi:hypothetical protein
VREIRRLGQFGLTESELQRYKQASLGEAMQGAAQAGQKGHDDVMSTWICACSAGTIAVRYSADLFDVGCLSVRNSLARFS